MKTTFQKSMHVVTEGLHTVADHLPRSPFRSPWEKESFVFAEEQRMICKKAEYVAVPRIAPCYSVATALLQTAGVGHLLHGSPLSRSPSEPMTIRPPGTNANGSSKPWRGAACSCASSELLISAPLTATASQIPL